MALRGRPGIHQPEWTIFCLRDSDATSIFGKHADCLRLFVLVCLWIWICSLRLRLWQSLDHVFLPGVVPGSGFFDDFYQHCVLFNFIWMHIEFPHRGLWRVIGMWL